ncbi:uncharacterized protein [Solanum lycopersicum]|uniref:uncharacterized protein n=1 Tax=Solanum lycopersicum TaxID=4081 RepID=UPI0037484E9D
MRSIIAQMAQAMITQAQASTVHAHALTAQPNPDVSVRPHQQVTTMASCLRDFTRMITPNFYGSKVDKDPQEFLYEVYKVPYAMEVTLSEMDELDSYKLKDVAQTWYGQWRHNRSLRGGPLTWEIFKAAFTDRFFPREIREEKVVEFINLLQGGKSVHEYSSELVKFSRYASSLVSDPRDQLISFGKRIEEARAIRKRRDAKRASSIDGGSSMNRLEIKDKPKFKKWGSNQVPSKFPTASGDRVSNPTLNKGGTNSTHKKPTCGKCGKKHYGECLKGTDNFFSCGKSSHKMRDFPNLKSQDKRSGQAHPSGSGDAPKKNRFYALSSRGE